MFPPKRTKDLKTWITGLHESLSRAGPHLSQDARLSPTDGGSEVVLFIHLAIPKEARAPMLRYVKQYASESGWVVKEMRLTSRYLTFKTASKP